MKKIYVTAYPFMCPIRNTRFQFREASKKFDKGILMKELSEYNPDGIIAGLEVFDEDVLNVCPNLKVISRVGSGFDNIDIHRLIERNIKLFTTPDEPVQAVAELVIAQMINLLRRLPDYGLDDLMNYQETESLEWYKYMGKCLSDCTVGIIGVGHIGSRVASLLDAIGATVLKYDILYDKCTHNLEEVLKESDIITLHIPMNTANKHFINIEKLKLMKPTAFLINTSRGSVVDENALYGFLHQDKIAGAALDVYSEEPYYGRLRYLRNVYTTPHIGSYTEKTREKMATKALTNCINYLISL